MKIAREGVASPAMPTVTVAPSDGARGRRKARGASLLSCLALAACATPAADMAVRPLHDLNLLSSQTPDVLVQADVAPYAAPASTGCSGVLAELAALDAALGPDVDAPRAAKGDAAVDLLRDALQGAVDLPYRSAWRELSGAAAEDRAHAAAVLAGMVRRGFLKGLSHALSCSPHGPEPGP